MHGDFKLVAQTCKTSHSWVFFKGLLQPTVENNADWSPNFIDNKYDLSILTSIRVGVRFCTM